MFYVYIVRCADDTLYTGFTTDIQKRVLTHNTAKGAAKYTRMRRPVSLVYSEFVATKGEALSREIAIKKLSRAEKLLLIQKT